MSEGNTIFFNRANDQENGGEGSSEGSDIWDDTLLIEAYDRAVKIAKENCGEKLFDPGSGKANKKKAKKEMENQKWKVGDKCKCQYSEDLVYYEADIVEIIGSTGLCKVKYVGYNNEEKVALKNLKLSEGEGARLQQIRDAAIYNENNENFGEGISSGSNQSCSNKNSTKKKPIVGKKGHSRERFQFSNGTNPPANFSSSHALNSIIPPPPPPHMFRNFCEDEDETEAMSAMLISWYMSGYHTGYYQGLKMANKQ